MNVFDKITKELGWKKPFKKIPLYTKSQSDDCDRCVFDINNTYDIFKDDMRVDENFVKDSINSYFPSTIYKKDDSKWVLFMLASDYYAHKFDWNNELIWAKKAIKVNNKLSAKNFSNKIKDKL
jgi:hypothetical protein